MKLLPSGKWKKIVHGFSAKVTVTQLLLRARQEYFYVLPSMSCQQNGWEPTDLVYIFCTGNIFPVAVQGNNEVSMWDMETGDRRFTLWASSAPPLSELQVWFPSFPVSVVWPGLEQSQAPCCASAQLCVSMAKAIWHLNLPWDLFWHRNCFVSKSNSLCKTAV